MSLAAFPLGCVRAATQWAAVIRSIVVRRKCAWARDSRACRVVVRTVDGLSGPSFRDSRYALCDDRRWTSIHSPVHLLIPRLQVFPFRPRHFLTTPRVAVVEANRTFACEATDQPILSPHYREDTCGMYGRLIGLYSGYYVYGICILDYDLSIRSVEPWPEDSDTPSWSTRTAPTVLGPLHQLAGNSSRREIGLKCSPRERH